MKKQQGTLSVKMDLEYLQYLRMLSHKIAIQKNEDISLSDIVRDIIEEKYPMPKNGK